MKRALGLAVAALAPILAASEEPTPVTRVDAWELGADFAKVDQQWSAIQAVLDDEAYFRVADEKVSAWSCGQQAGHLAIVNKFVAENILQNLKEPTRNADGTQVAFAKGVFEQGFIPRGVGKAPSEYKPEKETREELKATLAEAARLWKQVKERADELPGCEARFPHFAFGQLTSTEWVRLVAVHNAHHLRIIRDILRASGASEKGFGAELMAPLPPPWN